MKALVFILTGMCMTFATYADEGAVKLHDAPDRELVVARCSICHSIDYVPMNAPVFDRAGWQKSVRKMIDVFGAPISEDDAQRIVEYLGNNY
jgi:sulfite dehydrogenase (cytochrome) subunit B